MSEPSLEQTAALLAEVFPGAERVSDPAYLRWLYAASPYGPVLERNLVDAAGLAAHYAIVPITLSVEGSPVRGALSLNTAVHERARGGGTFVRLATETFDAAPGQGIRVILGVANANSTPGFERRLGFANNGPLPANVLVPTPGPRGGIRSAWAAGGPDLLARADPLLTAPQDGLARLWTEDELRWRVSCPGTRYALHRSEEILAISSVERQHGVPVALILGAFAAQPLAAGARRKLVRAICAFHRAPIALHVGHNARVPLNGVPLPTRLRPSPLNLISRGLDGTPVPARASRFELIDFDAY